MRQLAVDVAYLITLYTTKMLHSHGRFFQWSQGHWQFSSVVTWSQAVFGQSQAVTPVAALSMALIRVTTERKGLGTCLDSSCPHGMQLCAGN